jgi:Tol biopolymer transport system component
MLCTGLLLLAATPYVARGDDLQPVLKLAFVSNRQHYWYPHVYFYEHDGKSSGRLSGPIDPRDQRLDHQPQLSADGAWCLFGFEGEGEVGKLRLWDLNEGKERPIEEINKGPNALFSPSLSADMTLVAFTGWGRAGASRRWDVFLYDLTTQTPLELPGLNSAEYDERLVTLSGDGRKLAFTTNAEDGAGLTDIRLYDRGSGQLQGLPQLNSPATDSYPSLSGDGRWLCFVSDRLGGAGGRDVYLYDCRQQRLESVPGLNSPGHEMSPSITADGRYIAFVSERFDGAGEHDVFLYDREQQKLLETPDLNTARDDYDPCVIRLKVE